MRGKIKVCHGGLDPPSPENYQEIAGLRFAAPAMTGKAKAPFRGVG